MKIQCYSKCYYCHRQLEFENPWPYKHTLAITPWFKGKDIESVAHCKCGWLYACFEKENKK